MQKKQNKSSESSEKNPQRNVPLGKTGKDGVMAGKVPDRKQAMRDERREEEEEALLPEDPDPILDEQDLEENHLSVDDADKIEWDPESKTDER
jgi:hypothetical protein